MKRLLTLSAALALTLVWAGSTFAADELLPHSGRVLISLGGDVDLAADEQADAILVVNGDATVEGTANTIAVFNGAATLRGATTETLFVANGSASLDAQTRVLNGVREFGSTVDAPAGVSVQDVSSDVAGFGLFLGTAAVLLWIGIGLATVIFALLLAAIAARQLRAATGLISREPGRTALAGLAGLILPPLIAALAIVTLVGIPLGLGLLLIVWPMAAFVGYIVGALWIGEWIQGRRRLPEAPLPDRPYGAILIGLLVAFVLGFVPLVTAIISLFGLGAVTLVMWRTLRGRRTPAPQLRREAAPLAG
jgi:hypothetical protein